eukprot:TRINITY_DN27018_c0_g1_i1.p1 TRINITY_DN27018_c0_g1~~TRINITY_DN27018_c0_g1_i1.p1  ORF type:complete len:216 (+),score=25.41 TRINITY_DN27018_c0_g1_i1:65-712(+)
MCIRDRLYSQRAHDSKEMMRSDSKENENALRMSTELLGSSSMRRGSGVVLGDSAVVSNMSTMNTLSNRGHIASSSRTSVIEREIIEWLRDLQIIKDARINSLDKLKDAVKTGKLLYQITQVLPRKRGIRGYVPTPSTTDECLINLRVILDAIREDSADINEIFLDELEIYMFNKPVVLGLLKSLRDHLKEQIASKGDDTKRSYQSSSKSRTRRNV